MPLPNQVQGLSRRSRPTSTSAIVFKLIQDALSAITPQYWTFWLGLFLVVLVLVGRERLLKPWTWFKRGKA